MMHLARELCGGQICVTPTTRCSTHPEPAPLAAEVLHGQRHLAADDRRRLLAFARDLLNSDYAGHRLTFQLFAQSPPFAHLVAVYRNFDFAGPLDLVRGIAAGLSARSAGCRRAIAACARSTPATPIRSSGSATISARP